MSKTKQTESQNAAALSDEQIADINGGGSGSGSGMNTEVFVQTLVDGGAANDPTLTELLNAALTGDWKRVGILLPQKIGNPLVAGAMNAAMGKG